MSANMNASNPKKLKLSKGAEESIDEVIERVKASQNNLSPVINEDIFKPIPNIKAMAATIKNPKDISKTLLKLNEKIPLYNLQHLKRVSKRETIICTLVTLNGETVEDYLKKKIEGAEGVFEEFKEVNVPMLPPKTKKQYYESNKIWPCNFHPNKYYEDLTSGSFFNENDLKKHKTFMEIVLEVAKYYIKDSDVLFEDVNACVVVDPDLQSVVAVAYDNKQNHPIQHAAMIAIDNVAKTQNGGAWTQSEESQDIDIIYRGINHQLLDVLKCKFPDQKFGAKPFKSKRSVTENETNASNDLGPYLCTNYGVYLLREPCVMCAMALVHARARRVYFCLDNEEYGGVKSKTKLQTVSSLNHHFEVFTGFL